MCFILINKERTILVYAASKLFILQVNDYLPTFTEHFKMEKVYIVSLNCVKEKEGKRATHLFESSMYLSELMMVGTQSRRAFSVLYAALC